jgi:hypothetical protein
MSTEKCGKSKALPTADEIRALLDYDPLTGAFTWRHREGESRGARYFNTRFAGKPAGTVSSDGYLMILLGGIPRSAHRLAWLVVTGNWPETEIDHRDVDKLNNRFDNLRLATRSQNNANRPAQRNNKTGFKGVSRNKNKFVAMIKVDGRPRWLGSFDTPQEAHAAYFKTAQERHGSFARAS